MVDSYTKGKSTGPDNNVTYFAEEFTTATPYVNMNKQQVQIIWE